MAFVWQNRTFNARQLGEVIVNRRLRVYQIEECHKPDPGEQYGTPMAQSVVSIVVLLTVNDYTIRRPVFFYLLLYVYIV